MADRPRKGLLSSLWSAFDRRRPSPDSFLDAMLMVGLAEGPLRERQWNRLARAVLQQEELEGLDWLEVKKRAQELANAKGYEGLIRRIERELPSVEEQQQAIALSARMTLADAPSPKERGVMDAMADAFGIGARAVTALLDVAPPPFRLDFRRTAYNDPELDVPPRFFDALGAAVEDQELALMLFKLDAVRVAISRSFEGAEVVGVGELVKVGPHNLRIDAIVDADSTRWLMRFLAPDEALYESERRAFSILVDRLESSSKLFFGHCGEMSPIDAEFLKELEPDVRVEEMT